jgi:hypothetical protein
MSIWAFFIIRFFKDHVTRRLRFDFSKFKNRDGGNSMARIDLHDYYFWHPQGNYVDLPDEIVETLNGYAQRFVNQYGSIRLDKSEPKDWIKSMIVIKDRDTIK